MVDPSTVWLEWASQLGLATAPLFAPQENPTYEHHAVLLNGGTSGSFALSVGAPAELDPAVGSWIWSSDLGHHVAVGADTVLVSRWDDPSDSRSFSRRSVSNKLEEFYRFLTVERKGNSTNVVDHALYMFRRIRALTSHYSRGEEQSVNLFLYALAAMMASDADAAWDDPLSLLNGAAIDEGAVQAIGEVGVDRLRDLVSQYGTAKTSAGSHELFPRLAVRHAGGLVFQEAHFELVSAPAPDLFGFVGPATVTPSTRGGTHFTPPALARTIVEQVLEQLGSLGTRSTLTVGDPACGSGAFLHELLRAIRRAGFAGELRLHGMDNSPHAVAMARFVLNQAIQDWRGGRVEVQIDQCDALDLARPWPICDAIVMNPPFIAWPALSMGQREVVRSILQDRYRGRADYSMAFVSRAINAVPDGGIVATLIPASLLASSHAVDWRRYLAEVAHPTFIASIGEHSLFRHALVQVASLVLRKGTPAEGDASYIALWTGNGRRAAGEAMRNLRRASPLDAGPLRGDDWRLAREAREPLGTGKNWRPQPKRLDRILDEITQAVSTTVSGVFSVRQGIRAGLLDVFLLSNEEYSGLSSGERRFFRPAIRNRHVQGGRLIDTEYLFYPSTTGLPPIETEADLRAHIPRFFETRLFPHRSELQARADIARRTGPSADRWWELSQGRSWLEDPRPKIVTTYFGTAGAFAADFKGDRLVLQGHAWLPVKAVEQRASKRNPADVLAAYVALLNSRVFSLLLAEFCNHVSGGQFDLSKRFVDDVPLPDLTNVHGVGESIVSLQTIGHALAAGTQTLPLPQADAIAADLYGVSIDEWPVN